jgi:hypothetical protein
MDKIFNYKFGLTTKRGWGFKADRLYPVTKLMSGAEPPLPHMTLKGTNSLDSIV